MPTTRIIKSERAEHLAEILKAIAHPLRLRLVALLAEKEQCVTELAEQLGVNQAIASQQLRILRMRGLVAVSRSNGFANYRLAEPRLINLLECIEGCRR